MLPKQLKYGSKVESAAARSSRINIAPQNGTGPYQLGDLITINIPTRSNIVLATGESYLKFTMQGITCATASSLRFDSCGAHGLIQRIRIYHGSNLLEDIDNYGMLAKMLFDIQVPTDSAYGKFNILAGTRNDLSALVTNAIVTAGDPVQCLQVCAGEQIYSATNAGQKTLSNGDTSVTTTYCLNLISLMGTLSTSQYFPLMACTSAPIRMEIQLIDTLTKGINTVTAGTLGATTGLMNNVEFIANIIELGDSAVQMIESSLEGQPLQYTYADFRNYAYSYAIANSATPVTMPIPAKFSSLKSIFLAIRDKGFGALTFYPFSSVNYGLTDYQFRIGPTVVPSKAISTSTEQFAELVKAIGSMSDLTFQPNISKTCYNVATSTANSVAIDTYGGTNVSSGAFFIGLDLENYVSAPKDSIFAGWNSNTDDIFCLMNFSGSAGAGTVRFDAYALFDVVICFENGTAFIRY